MSLTVADLAHPIVTLRRLYERVLQADFGAGSWFCWLLYASGMLPGY
jgi:hypothetical protein